MAKYELSHDILNRRIAELRGLQDEIVRDILYDNGRSMGGCIGSVTGRNGRYDLESIFLDEKCEYVEQDEYSEIPIACHLDYPAFEVDVNFYDLSIDERQQIVEMLIAESQKL